MKKPELIQFTRPEINHLQHALIMTQRDQSYFGRRDQFWRRHNRLMAKLAEAVEKKEQSA